MKIIGFKKQQKMTKNLKFLEGRNLPSIQKTTKTLIILFILLLSFVNINAQSSYRLFPYGIHFSKKYLIIFYILI